MKTWFVGVPLCASVFPWLLPGLLDDGVYEGRLLGILAFGLIPFVGAVCVVRYRPPEVELRLAWPLAPFVVATVVSLASSVVLAVLVMRSRDAYDLQFTNLYSSVETAALYSLLAQPFLALVGGDAVVSRIRADRSARDGHPPVTS